MYTLIVRTRFEAAHDIPGYQGKCSRLHGHGYRVEVEFTGKELNEIGMLHDFADLKDSVNAVLPDHLYLNDVMQVPTSAENIAKWIYDRLAERDLPVSAVTLWETENNGCRYTPE